MVVAVLGAGLAGLAAAGAVRRAGRAAAVYEKEETIGGHARSHPIDGFTFDEGPHVSFTKNAQVQALFAAAVEGRFREHDAAVLNYWRGHVVPHPAVCHLHGLPVEIVQRCLLDFVAAQADGGGEPADYADWCRRAFGRTFSDEFAFRYTRKYWTVEADRLTTEWVGGRVHRPSLEQVVRGALAPQPPSHHYITRFRYPERGGFGAYARAVHPEDDSVHLGCEVTLIDLARRRLEFADGRSADYDVLISSLPVPELVWRIKDVPAEVADAAGRLLCTSVVLVNLGLERDDGFPAAHWAYLYDEECLASRVHFPHRLSPHNAPPGCGSVQAEVYFSRHRPLPTADVLGRTVEDLTRTGLLRPGERLRVARTQVVPYANVVFDGDRAASLAAVRDFLERHGVIGCGRYGEWAYYWTDDSIKSGWRAAERALALRT